MSVASSVEPWMRNFAFPQAARARSRFESAPALYEARAKWRADEPPSTSYRDRRTRRRSAAVHLEDDRVALATAGADCGHAEAAAPAAQLVHERAEDPCS